MVLGLAEAPLGLDWFKVLGVVESEDGLAITVETIASVIGCWSSGVLADFKAGCALTYAISPASYRQRAWSGRSDATAPKRLI
jgi:hypothetical protein